MSKGSCRGGALRRMLFMLPLAGIAVRCQLLAGIEDIAYSPDASSAGVAQGSSGSSQGADDAGADGTQSSGSTGSGATSGTTSGASGTVMPASGADTSGSASGASASGAASGSTSGSAAGSTSGGSAGATSGTVMPSSGAATGGSSSGGAKSGAQSGSSVSGASGSASGSSSGTGGADGGPKCRSNQLSPIAAVASSVEGQTDATTGFLVAADAIDGNFATRWASLFMTDPSWIDVDFGAPVFIDEVDILWQSACASAYDIEVSNDATMWTLVKAVTGAPPTWAAAPPGWTNDAGMPTADVHKGLAGVGRYLRINATARCLAAYGYSMWEVRALGDTDASCTP